MLPTSLTYIILSARGYRPRRPDAVKGTASSDEYDALFIPWVANHAPDTSEYNVICQKLNNTYQQKYSIVYFLLKRKDNASRNNALRHRITLCRHFITTHRLKKFCVNPFRNYQQSLRVQSVPVS